MFYRGRLPGESRLFTKRNLITPTTKFFIYIARLILFSYDLVNGWVLTFLFLAQGKRIWSSEFELKDWTIDKVTCRRSKRAKKCGNTWHVTWQVLWLVLTPVLLSFEQLSVKESEVSDWRRKHALVKDEKQEVEERIRKLELYISDLPTPDDMVKQNSEISFLLISSIILLVKSSNN